MLAGFVVVISSLFLFFFYYMLAPSILAWAVIGLCVLPLAIIYVGFLSLGMKFILIEGEYHALETFLETLSREGLLCLS